MKCVFGGDSLSPTRNDPEPDNFSTFPHSEGCAFTNGVVVDFRMIHQLHLAIKRLVGEQLLWTRKESDTQIVVHNYIAMDHLRSAYVRPLNDEMGHVLTGGQSRHRGASTVLVTEECHHGSYYR